MRVLVAPDKFRSTLGAAEAAEALAHGVALSGHEAALCPLADGGEGTLDALGGANRTTIVSGPLGDPVEAVWRISRRVAVIEMAAASGLAVVGGASGNDPIAASTYGTGELIAAALDAGAKEIVVGVGGSSTTDGGLGAIGALHPLGRLRGIRLIAACDVRIRFERAAELFAPQKGATPAQVELLSRRLSRLRQVYFDDYGVDVAVLDHSGAGGGLAGGLAAVGAELVGGFDVVADSVGFDELLEGSDLVITGEGFMDDESFDGKVVGGVVERAEQFGVPVVVVVGDTDSRSAASVEARGHRVFSLVAAVGPERAHDDAAASLSQLAAAALGAR